MPYDPEKTSAHVRGDVMRVGVVRGSAPWASIEDGEASGVEADLVRGFAGKMDARVEWIAGKEARLMDALEHYELDMVIGGLDKRSPYRRHVALSNSYHRSRVRIGVPQGMDKPDDLTGREVAVAAGTATARLVRAQGAKPIALDRRRSGDVLVAGPDWQLRHWGLQLADPVLRKDKHVFAVPRGENGWLVALEKHLHARKDHVARLIRSHADTRAAKPVGDRHVVMVGPR